MLCCLGLQLYGLIRSFRSWMITGAWRISEHDVKCSTSVGRFIDAELGGESSSSGWTLLLTDCSCIWSRPFFAVRVWLACLLCMSHCMVAAAASGLCIEWIFAKWFALVWMINSTPSLNIWKLPPLRRRGSTSLLSRLVLWLLVVNIASDFRNDNKSI